MQIIGIDLGTTNIRVSTWDSDQPDLAPEPQTLGEGDSKTMPAVVAIQMEGDDVPKVIVGEEADGLEDNENQLVLRNLKRYALGSDTYVRQRLTELEEWWDPESRCVNAFGKEFPIKDLLAKILGTALERAGVKPGFEWAAGCPVHAGITYRSELSEIITELGGSGRGEPNRIIEEPILLLIAAYRLRRLKNGASYLVYDLGGGSFDCALAQIEEDTESEDGVRMVVYGAHGDPALGGSDIDKELRNSEFAESFKLLREAKEILTPSNRQVDLLNGKSLTWEDVADAVKRLLFIFKTTVTMRSTYRDAKVVWHRTDDNVPVGEILSRSDNGIVEFVGQLNWDNLIEDVDGIILCGGPTRSALFYEELKARFGEARIISVSDSFPGGTADPELTAISMGACYAYQDNYGPLYVSRLPVGIELEDLTTGKRANYEPFSHFGVAPANSTGSYISNSISVANESDTKAGGRFELTVTTPGGAVLFQNTIDETLGSGARNSNLRLVINRLGQVGVEQLSAYSTSNLHLVIEEPFWQTETQRSAFFQLRENLRKSREQERIRFDQIQFDTLWA